MESTCLGNLSRKKQNPSKPGKKRILTKYEPRNNGTDKTIPSSPDRQQNVLGSDIQRRYQKIGDGVNNIEPPDVDLCASTSKPSFPNGESYASFPNGKSYASCCHIIPRRKPQPHDFVGTSNWSEDVTNTDNIETLSWLGNAPAIIGNVRTNDGSRRCGDGNILSIIESEDSNILSIIAPGYDWIPAWFTPSDPTCPTGSSSEDESSDTSIMAQTLDGLIE